ncbi:MAG: OmpA family protein [Hyphomicrobiaceae bacterium]
MQADAAAAKRRAEQGRCVAQLTDASRTGAINFDWASFAIDAESRQRLARFAAIAKSCPDVVIELAGHADAEGLPERKQRLSEQRARAAADFLIKAGIPKSQIKTAGFADTKPVASNQTDEGRARNRRVEITVKAR